MLKAIYRTLVPFSVRQSIYRMRHPRTVIPKESSRKGIARSLYEMGRTREAAKELRDGALYDKDLIPILYSLGNIEAAHRSYRYRATSELIAESFNQPIRPSKISIRSDRRASGLMLAEGGPGDEIRNAAIYDEVAEHFDTLTITCDPRLHRMLERSFPSISFLPVPRYRSEELISADAPDRENVDRRLKVFVNEEVINRSADLVFSTLDALGEFRQRRSDFHRSPHLLADSALVRATKQRIGPTTRMQIGLCWRSMRQSTLRNRHYLSIGDLAPLAAVEADFWLLQIDATDTEIAMLRTFLPLRTLDGLDIKNDLEGQAALIVNMDAVISPLTSTAELAGALGVPTFIAAPDRSTEWRRNEDGSDVWYSSARLFSSVSAGGRENIVAAIASETNFGFEATQSRLRAN